MRARGTGDYKKLAINHICERNDLDWLTIFSVHFLQYPKVCMKYLVWCVIGRIYICCRFFSTHATVSDCDIIIHAVIVIHGPCWRLHKSKRFWEVKAIRKVWRDLLLMLLEFDSTVRHWNNKEETLLGET